MRILSKSLKYQHLIQNAVVQIGQDEQGVLRERTVKPMIMLEFSRSGLTAYDIEFGMRHWQKGTTRDYLDQYGAEAWGAHPDTRVGVIGGTIYDAWDPSLQFSIYITDGLEQGDVRDAIEAFFTKNPEGQDWIVVTQKALVPPWKTYNDMHAAKIAPFAADAGVLVEALAYEQAMENRESVVAALKKRLEEKQQEAQEDAALSVIIP